MDILGILQALKGKVLDATHFELLKHAYELQEQNINQLKSYNSAIRESNDLLKEKVAELQKEIRGLRASLESLEKRLPAAPPSEYPPSRAAAAILERYVKDDKNEFYDQQLFRLSTSVKSRSRLGWTSSANANSSTSVRPTRTGCSITSRQPAEVSFSSHKGNVNGRGDS